MRHAVSPATSGHSSRCSVRTVSFAAAGLPSESRSITTGSAKSWRRIVSPDDQRRIHGLMVRAWSPDGADDPEALYSHCRGAGDRDGASTQAALAARKAEAALAFDRAASFYRSALELAPDAPAAASSGSKDWRSR